jgi:hypothetical protein
MNKELREAKLVAVRRVLFLLIVVGALSLGLMMGSIYTDRLNAASKQADMTPVREMLINAIRNTKVDAPIDPRTGDIYFPQAKLYLPNNSSYTQLTYAYNPGDGADLTIASKTALNQGIAALYNARDIRELFAKLPYLQACQRGITVTYSQNNESEKKLSQTVKLNNGKTIYLYIEKACPELGETAELLKNLKAY